MEKQLTFRIMTKQDIDDILNIEHQAFPHPWSRESFVYEITKNPFAHYIVLEEEGKVIGYCGSWVIEDEAHITNIALLPEYRGKKLGESLLRKVMESVKEMGATRMTLEVRVSNFVARSLYCKLGFREVGIRKNYYTDNQEDAIIMWVNLQ